jgi:hypothetical protein
MGLGRSTGKAPSIQRPYDIALLVNFSGCGFVSSYRYCVTFCAFVRSLRHGQLRFRAPRQRMRGCGEIFAAVRLAKSGGFSAAQPALFPLRDCAPTAALAARGGLFRRNS